MKKISSVLIIAAVFTGFLLPACAPPPPPPPEVAVPVKPEVITVNHHTFTDEIINYPGPAIVVFYNTQFWQAMDMERRIEWLAKKYPGKAKFAKFHWQMKDDPSRFKLEMLPTTILYRNGYEIDRIKGIPPQENERRKWNDDLDLWFLANALQLKGGKYSGDYTYLFKNDYTLKTGNY